MKYISKIKIIIVYIAFIVICIYSYKQTLNLSDYFNNYEISVSFDTICGQCNKLVDGNYCKNCGFDEILVINNRYCRTCSHFKDGTYCNECGNKLGYAKFLSEIPEDLKTLNNKNNLCIFFAYTTLFSGLIVIISTVILIIEAIDILSKLIRRIKNDNCNNN